MQGVNKSNRSGYDSLLKIYREADLSQEKTRILGTVSSSEQFWHSQALTLSYLSWRLARYLPGPWNHSRIPRLLVIFRGTNIHVSEIKILRCFFNTFFPNNSGRSFYNTGEEPRRRIWAVCQQRISRDSMELVESKPISSFCSEVSSFPGHLRWLVDSSCLQAKWDHLTETYGAGFLITRFISAIVSPVSAHLLHSRLILSSRVLTHHVPPFSSHHMRRLPKRRSSSAAGWSRTSRGRSCRASNASTSTQPGLKAFGMTRISHKLSRSLHTGNTDFFLCFVWILLMFKYVIMKLIMHIIRFSISNKLQFYDLTSCAVAGLALCLFISLTRKKIFDIPNIDTLSLSKIDYYIKVLVCRFIVILFHNVTLSNYWCIAIYRNGYCYCTVIFRYNMPKIIEYWDFVNFDIFVYN